MCLAAEDEPILIGENVAVESEKNLQMQRDHG